MLHFLHPFLPSLLELVHRVEQLLLMMLIQALLVFIDLLEYFIRVFWDGLLQFFELFLEFSILAHRNLISHIKITLILRAIAHEGPKAASWIFGKIGVSGSNSLILSLDLSSDLLDHLSSTAGFLFHLDLILNLNLTHC